MQTRMTWLRIPIRKRSIVQHETVFNLIQMKLTKIQIFRMFDLRPLDSCPWLYAIKRYNNKNAKISVSVRVNPFQRYEKYVQLSKKAYEKVVLLEVQLWKWLRKNQFLKQ